MTTTDSSSEAAAYRSVNPANGQVVASFAGASDDEVEAVLASAQSSYVSWSSLPSSERVETARRVARLFGERKHELAALAQVEMGKPLSEGVEEAEFCESIFGYFADEADRLTSDEVIATGQGRAVIQRRPIGPVLGIMPWNFPFYQVARFFAPNLVLGNPVVLKHAESVPQSALALARLFTDAGVPEGVYANVFASHDQVESIIADERVQGVSLTGSERAGSAVAALAGRHLTKCVLELGGSDPMIVLDSEDVSVLAAEAWAFRIYNTGQACNANKRIIVMADVYEEFVTELVRHARALGPGDFSPMSSRLAAEAVDDLVQEAIDGGATLHAGGHLGDSPTAFYSPAVLTGVTREMRAYREEVFGPVAVVYRVETEEDAIEVANDTPFGLGGSVFSVDAARAARVADRLHVGMANVNTIAGEGAEIPFGGTKRSGFGRELGPLGMDEFVNKRVFFTAE